MNPFNRLRRLWKRYQLQRNLVPWHLWHDVVVSTPVLASLSKAELVRLRSLASLFLQRKTINGAGGMVVDDRVRVTIAAQACLLVLNLGLDYFDGWVEIIVYPQPFVAEHTDMDEYGVVHQQHRELGGESWGRGPVILAWSDIIHEERYPGEIRNVVLHEFAHKLDTLNGPADGLPPLHREMAVSRWSLDLGSVYETLQRQVESEQDTVIDPYASVSPAEFFAVITEYFFEAPKLLFRFYPHIYQELKDFYRQNPRSRHSKPADIAPS